MKMSILLSVGVFLTCIILSSCIKEVAAEPEQISGAEGETETAEASVVETLVSTDGNAIVLGHLVEFDLLHVVINTDDNQRLSFNLNQETEIYSGSAPELILGDEVAIVFEGVLDGLNTDDIKVLTVSIAAEEDTEQ